MTYTPPSASDLAEIRDRVDRMLTSRRARGTASVSDIEDYRNTVNKLIDMHLALAAEADRRIFAAGTHVPPWVRHAARVRIEAVDGTVLDVDGDEFRDYWHNGTVNEALSEEGGWPDLDPPTA